VTVHEDVFSCLTTHKITHFVKCCVSVRMYSCINKGVSGGLMFEHGDVPYLSPLQRTSYITQLISRVVGISVLLSDTRMKSALC
jgi:hypothetical protein